MECFFIQLTDARANGSAGMAPNILIERSEVGQIEIFSPWTRPAKNPDHKQWTFGARLLS
jgi:hypothetical protein